MHPFYCALVYVLHIRERKSKNGQAKQVVADSLFGDKMQNASFSACELARARACNGPFRILFLCQTLALLLRVTAFFTKKNDFLGVILIRFDASVDFYAHGYGRALLLRVLFVDITLVNIFSPFAPRFCRTIWNFNVRNLEDII